MPEDIGLADMRRLVEERSQVVEVLPPSEYAAEHLPGAVNIPLKSLSAATAAQLDTHSRVAVYCWDYF